MRVEQFLWLKNPQIFSNPVVEGIRVTARKATVVGYRHMRELPSVEQTHFSAEVGSQVKFSAIYTW